MYLKKLVFPRPIRQAIYTGTKTSGYYLVVKLSLLSPQTRLVPDRISSNYHFNGEKCEEGGCQHHIQGKGGNNQSVCVQSDSCSTVMLKLLIMLL